MFFFENLFYLGGSIKKGCEVIGCGYDKIRAFGTSFLYAGIRRSCGRSVIAALLYFYL